MPYKEANNQKQNKLQKIRKFIPWPLYVAANISQLAPNWSGLSAGQLHLQPPLINASQVPLFKQGLGRQDCQRFEYETEEHLQTGLIWALTPTNEVVLVKTVRGWSSMFNSLAQLCPGQLTPEK